MRAPAAGRRYETIGQGYAHTRREDPELLALIERTLGDADTVVNVGAGTGSYEPSGRHVIAIEPSDVMAAQRGPGRVPAIAGTAGALPLRNRSVDAAMAVLSLHHWDGEQEAGVRELRRVARGPVLIVTFDPRVSSQMWLMRDYLPEVAQLDHRIFPTPERIADWLGGSVETIAVPTPAQTPDWTLASFWAHPERVLDADARHATSGFARMTEDVVRRVVLDVACDLHFGVWDQRNGHLRTLAEYDAGMRVVVGSPDPQTGDPTR